MYSPMASVTGEGICVPVKKGLTVAAILYKSVRDSTFYFFSVCFCFVYEKFLLLFWSSGVQKNWYVVSAFSSTINIEEAIFLNLTTVVSQQGEC